MPHRTFNADGVAEYLHLPRSDIDQLVKQGDIPFALRGGRAVFLRGEIDAWASQRILAFSSQRLASYHEGSMRSARQIFAGDALIPELIQPDYLDVALRSKTKASVIRDMVALAERTGRVLDPRELLASVQDREKLCSTALPNGLVLLHSRHHQEYRFEGSFMVLGRTVQQIPFGAPDGQPSRVFFLICCQDDRIHLHTLARVCLMAHKTDLIAQLLEVPDASTGYDLLVSAEKTVLLGKKTLTTEAGGIA